ncbi:nucleotide pyrophosphatase, partial [Pseudomonas sp. MWU12-2534b]
MIMSFLGKQRRWVAVVAGALALAGAGAHAAQQDGDSQREDRDHAGRVVKHVLLISVDGLHEQDLARCIGANTCPN